MDNVNQFIDAMTTPDNRLIEDMKRIDDDIMILGAGGKVGATVAITAKRAMDAAKLSHRVIAVSLFDYQDSPIIMQNAGVDVIEADLSDEAQLEKLPKVHNIIYMVGKKFGTTLNFSQTWFVNVILPAMIAKHFSNSNIVLFSTGNVYGMRDISSGGALEDSPLEPVGEYAQTCVGRERVMEHFSKMNGTPMLFFRLNYAIDMRYGVLHDIAMAVYHEHPVDLSAGYFNCIWQGDVAKSAIRSLLHCKTPPEALNVTGSEAISIKWAAEEFGRKLGKEVHFVGEIPHSSLFSNATKANKLFGYPSVTLGEMIDWTVDWCLNGGEVIAAPTHFEDRSGKF
jgi:nucleoside-diphosphate-sugar epimerase